MSPHSTATAAESSASNSLERVEQRGRRRTVDRVARLRPVHDHRGHRAVAFDPHSPAHVFATSSWSVGSRRAVSSAANSVVGVPECVPRPVSRQQFVGQHRIGQQVPNHAPPRSRTASARRSAAAIPSSSPVAVAAQAGRSHSWSRELLRRVVDAVQHPRPFADLAAAVRVVGPRLSGRSHTPSRSSPNLLSCNCFRKPDPGPGVNPDAGDHQRRPRPVPRAAARPQRIVLAALPGQQPIRQPVAVGGADQVPRADHPGQRDPQRRLPDVEIGCQPDQLGRGRPRRDARRAAPTAPPTGPSSAPAPPCRQTPEVRRPWSP